MPEKTNITATDTTTRINRQTFETIYNMYWDKVYAVCYNNIRDIESAKEMVQDIFKSLWERRAELELEHVSNYLIRSAKFKTFEYIRNKVSREKHICLKYQDCSHSSNCTEEHINYNNLKESVNLLVDTLPCQCKKVYRMSREQGMSNKEIAVALLISERAVEYHITKSLAALRTRLANYSE
ncbi:RNA polymerase sigma-70 factor [Pedobacter gandavensis]|nr:RNA polymerase sigma-70 factor [Pedobacter gandavensis]